MSQTLYRHDDPGRSQGGERGSTCTVQRWEQDSGTRRGLASPSGFGEQYLVNDSCACPPFKPLREAGDYWGVTGPSLSYSEINIPKTTNQKKKNNQKPTKNITKNFSVKFKATITLQTSTKTSRQINLDFCFKSWKLSQMLGEAFKLHCLCQHGQSLLSVPDSVISGAWPLLLGSLPQPGRESPTGQELPAPRKGEATGRSLGELSSGPGRGMLLARPRLQQQWTSLSTRPSSPTTMWYRMEGRRAN